MRPLYLLVWFWCLALAGWSEPFFELNYESMSAEGVLPFRVSPAFLKQRAIQSMLLSEEESSEQWTFNGDGQPLQLDSRLGGTPESLRQWRYENGRLSGTTFTYYRYQPPHIGEARYSYQDGLLSQFLNGDDIRVDYTYQERRRSQEVCHNGKEVFISDYHYSGPRLTSITRKDGFYHRFGYDRQGRLASHTTPQEVQKLVYDKLGQLEQLRFYEKKRLTRLYRFGYDSQGLLRRFDNEDWETARPQFNIYTVTYPGTFSRGDWRKPRNASTQTEGPPVSPG